ncbi:MAG TPA: hypothetical protein VHM01_03645 [Alphaproteobacteria bacterium]|nr:hypothetical protein [Alphaproteobacteria bacterium]
MAPTKTDRQSRKAARVEQFETRTEADPLGAVQPDTDAEFTADGGIPPGEETTTEYVERIGRAAKGKSKPTR